jgi:hypothetical protein
MTGQCTYTSDNTKELWNIIEASDHDSMLLISLKTNRKFHCNNNGDLCTVSGQASRQTWCLERRLPDTISASQIWTRVGLGVGMRLQWVLLDHLDLLHPVSRY